MQEESITAINFEEILFEDIHNLFTHFHVPAHFCLRIKAEMAPLEIKGQTYHRPAVQIIAEQEMQKDDIMHVIRLDESKQVKVVISYPEIIAFARSKPDGIILRQDAPFLQAVKNAIQKRKESAAW